MPSSSSPKGHPLTASPLWHTVTKALVTLAVALATVPQPAAGQLALTGSCNIQTAQLDGSHLGMYCNNLNTASFGYNWTWIDLDLCIANSNGKLVGKKNGNFQASCLHCSTTIARLPSNPRAAGSTSADVYKSGLTLGLTCSCLGGRNRVPTTSTLDLNTVLVDVDGAMGCYGRLGNKTLRGPPPKH